MKKILFIFLCLTFFFSCNKNKEYFTVEGFIINGDGQRVYLEHNGLTHTTTIDSLDLNSIGRFDFKGECPQYPDFYSLRINDKRLIFAVDSTEKILISADYFRFAKNYHLTSSPNSEPIRELRKSVINIQNKIHSLPSILDEKEYGELATEIQKDIDEHRVFAREIILKQSGTLAAYFALFQKVNDTYIFNPYTDKDLPYWRTVATTYSINMPEYERTENLKTLVLDAVKYLEEEKAELKRQDALNDIMNKAVGYIDIALPDRNGMEKKLSELEGKVVLINFIAFEKRGSVEYTFRLRELYDKYNTQGFEIYQVSLDENKLFWDAATEALPWVCVHDTDGANAYYASIYNVKHVPTSFIMDRGGNILARDLSWEKLNNEIERLIKETNTVP